MKLWGCLQDIKAEFQLSDLVVVNMSRSFSILPIPAQTAVTESDILEEFSKVPEFSPKEEEAELEENYV
eukprot:639661-Amphidinium_carterae.1